MSNALAIGATTAVVRSILQGVYDSANLAGILGGNVTVSALPPDRIVTGPQEQPVLNLFLYQVSPNAAWRNVELPSRGTNGGRLENPPLALDLHYMMTAYGRGDVHAEVVLGFGLQALHEMPVLTRDAVRAVFSGGALPPLMARLATAELADQEELVTLTPQLLTTDELSKLWTGFQDKYRATAAFLATVVLIRSTAVLPTGPPVRKPLVSVRPLQNPRIQSVEPQMVVRATGASVQLVGEHLLAAGATTAEFSSGDATFASAPAVGSTPFRLLVPLPDQLFAGPNVVRVVQAIELGEPPAPHGGASSNSAVVVLRPVVKPKSGTTVPDLTIAAGRLTAKLDPRVGNKQVVELLLDEFGAPATRLPQSFTVPAEPRTGAPTDTVRFPLADVASGTYLLRVRVDGAETALETDGSGIYNAPQVTVP
jgi:hypothetical protein